MNHKVAAIHGDPDVRAPGKTRFGPTALLLPRGDQAPGNE